jgi:hypothetical protein
MAKMGRLAAYRPTGAGRGAGFIPRERAINLEIGRPRGGKPSMGLLGTKGRGGALGAPTGRPAREKLSALTV